MMTKKIINNGNHAVDEMLDGIIAAHPQFLRRVDGNPRSIVALDGPRRGKVGLVIGGGSGHEPTFLGFVGKGLADAAAIGNVFASPPRSRSWNAPKRQVAAWACCSCMAITPAT